jgi:HK97 family phage portal protein
LNVFKDWWSAITQRRDTSFIYDTDMWEPAASRVFIKRLAIDTVLNFVARSFAQSEFKVMNGDRVDKKSELYYRLNVQPNKNQTSVEFWSKLIYELLYNSETLVVQGDDGDIYVADSFMKNDLALYPDTFTGVTVGTYTYTRTFNMQDVLYIKNSNNRLEAYVSGLFDDTSELYGRMYDVAMREKQIRGIVKVGALTGTDKEKQDKLQNFIDNIFKQFNHRSIAIVPNGQGLDYTETNSVSETRSTSPLENLTTLRTQFMDDVAALVGVPPVLLHGQQAESDQAKQTFVDNCLGALNKLVEAALNSTFFTKAEYRRGSHINIVGLGKADLTKLAEPLDKLRAGGFVNGDEGRVLIGLDPTGKPEMQEYYVTKNYGQAAVNDNAGTGSTDTGADQSKEGGE